MRMKEFEKNWNKKIKEIKNKSLDNEACHEIHMIFIYDITYIEDGDFPLEKISGMMNNLKFSLEIANMNFKKENPTFLKRLKKIYLKLSKNGLSAEVKLK